MPDAQAIKTPAKVGRPLAIDRYVAKKICQRIARGRTLTAVAADRDLPGHDAIYEHMERDPEFAAEINRARAASAHALAEQTVTIADECNDPAIAQIVRMRIESRKWLASKWDAASYGDKAQVNVNLSLENLIERALVIDHDPAPPTQQLSSDDKAE